MPLPARLPSSVAALARCRECRMPRCNSLCDARISAVTAFRLSHIDLHPPGWDTGRPATSTERSEAHGGTAIERTDPKCLPAEPPAGRRAPAGAVADLAVPHPSRDRRPGAQLPARDQLPDRQHL